MRVTPVSRIGGEPHALPPEVSAHLATCAACRQFHAETMSLDGALRAALELPLAKFRKTGTTAGAPLRAGGIGGARHYSSAEVSGSSGRSLRSPAKCVEHVSHESGSWSRAAKCSPAVHSPTCCRQAGVQFDTSMPVVYAMACPFHGRRVPHLVVQTSNGPMTVMLLAHEKVRARQEFSEGGLSGRLAAGGRGQRRGADAERRGAGRRGDAGGQRGSLVASTSQPDCGSAEQLRWSSGSHSRISCSTR